MTSERLQDEGIEITLTLTTEDWIELYYAVTARKEEMKTGGEHRWAGQMQEIQEHLEEKLGQEKVSY